MHGRAASIALLALFVAPIACVQRPRMCAASAECGATAACVSGRCLPNGGVPAIQNARRMIVDPVDVAYLRPGAGASGGALPETFTLGRSSEQGAVLYLRFAVPLAKDATVLEAYLLLERSAAVDVDATPIALHAARVVEPWDGRFVSWLQQPRVEDTRSPSTTVLPARTLVRVDVRDLVLRWPKHEPSDQGIAVVAEGSSPTGLVFALAPSTATLSADSVAAPASPASPEPRADTVSGPRLELYVK